MHPGLNANCCHVRTLKLPLLLLAIVTMTGLAHAAANRCDRPCATGISDTTRCVCRLVESAVCAATVGGLHAAANKPVILLNGALPPSLSATPFSGCQCIGCCCHAAFIWQSSQAL